MDYQSGSRLQKCTHFENLLKAQEPKTREGNVQSVEKSQALHRKQAAEGRPREKPVSLDAKIHFVLKTKAEKYKRTTERAYACVWECKS